MAEPQKQETGARGSDCGNGGYGLKSGTVVIRNEENQIQVDAGRIEVMPVWRFLLNLPES